MPVQPHANSFRTISAALVLCAAPAACSPQDQAAPGDDQELAGETLDAPFPTHQGTATDYVPKLDSWPRLNSGEQTGVGDTTTQSAPSSSSSDESSSSTTESSLGPTTSSKSSTSSDDSSDITGTSTGEDDSVDTTATSTGEDDSSDTTATSTGGDDSSSSSTTGDTTDETTQAPLPDLGNMGLVARLRIPGPRMGSDRLRMTVFDIKLWDAMDPRPSKPAFDATYERDAMWGWQPLIHPNQNGDAVVVIPTPPQERMAVYFDGSVSEKSQAYESSPLMGLAIYEDLDNDETWTPKRDPFVAALPGFLVYLSATKDAPAHWRLVRMNEVLGSYNDIKIRSEKIDEDLDLARLDSLRQAPSLTGQTEEVEASISYLTLVSEAERLSLKDAFFPNTRAADIALREKDEERWTFTPRIAPSWWNREDPLVEVPGIDPDFSLTRWVVGYARPIGAPLAAPGSYLTPDSTLLAGVCPRGLSLSKFMAVAAFWLQSGPWASSPIGASYAAHYGLGSGWGFLNLNTRGQQPFEPKLLTTRSSSMAVAAQSKDHRCGLKLPSHSDPAQTNTP